MREKSKVYSLLRKMTWCLLCELRYWDEIDTNVTFSKSRSLHYPKLGRSILAWRQDRGPQCPILLLYLYSESFNFLSGCHYFKIGKTLFCMNTWSGAEWGYSLNDKLCCDNMLFCVKLRKRLMYCFMYMCELQACCVIKCQMLLDLITLYRSIDFQYTSCTTLIYSFSDVLKQSYL